MSYPVRIRITMLDNSTADITVLSDKIKPLKGLPSGQVVVMENKFPGSKHSKFLFKPYYRRYIAKELHIFGVEVQPEEGNNNGQ